MYFYYTALKGSIKGRKDIDMNKVILMGRVANDLTVRYTAGEESVAVLRYSLAVPRPTKNSARDEVDYINCVTFGKMATFAEKYFHKGSRILISGRIQTGRYQKDGKWNYTSDVIVETQEFADSKKDDEQTGNEGWLNIPDGAEEELPFN